MINIREYKLGDERSIYNMFDKHTPYKRDAPFWIWINRMLSDEKSVIALAELNEEIVGHYAILPRKCSIEGIELKCGLGIHAFVDPKYRTEISIFSISKLAYDLADSRGFDLVYGFPNANYRLIQQKIEKWKEISLFNAYIKSAHKVSKNNLIYSWNLVSGSNFDDFLRINELLELNEGKGNYFPKSLNYYLNRFLHHPHKPYEVWLLKKNNITAGAIVVKRFIDKVHRVHIVDYALLDNNSIGDILTDFESLYRDKTEEFCLWPTSKYFSRLLTDKGYKQTGFETFFGVKLLSDKSRELENQILNFKNWELFMSDSDAF